MVYVYRHECYDLCILLKLCYRIVYIFAFYIGTSRQVGFLFLSERKAGVYYFFPKHPYADFLFVVLTCV